MSPRKAKMKADGLPDDRGRSNRPFSMIMVWAAIAGICFYFALYLSVTQIETVTDNGQAISLTRLTNFIASLILLPEVIYREWFAAGSMPVNIADRLFYFGAAASWLVLAYHLGKQILAVLGLDRGWNRAEQLGLATALGLASLSHAVLFLGLFALLGSPWPLVGTIALAALLLGLAVQRSTAFGSTTNVRAEQGVNATDRAARSMPIGNQHEPDDAPYQSFAYTPVLDRRIVVILGIAITFLAFLYLFGAILPPIEFDVREYHLQVPKEFFQRGRIDFLPHNIYGNMPLGAEMHALAWMTLISGPQAWFAGALIGKVVIAAFALITALMLGGAAYRFGGYLAAFIAGFVYLSIPGISDVSRLGLVDAVLGCYLTALLVVWLGWSRAMPRNVSQEPSPQSQQARIKSVRLYGLLVGLLIGAAVACKYTAVPLIAVPAAFLFVSESWTRKGIEWIVARNWIACIVIGAVLMGGLWYAKNAWLADNPVYPLAYSVFGGRTMDAEKAAQWNHAHRTPPIALLRGETALVPAALDLLYRSPMQGIMLVPFAVIGFAVYRDRAMRLMGIFLLWYVSVWWLATHRLERFVVPMLPLLAIPAGRGAAWLARVYAGLPLAVILLVGVTFGCVQLATNANQSVDNRLLVSLDALHHQDEMRLSEYQRWLNEVLDATKRVLIVGDAQVFDIEIPIEYSTCFDESLLETLSKDRAPHAFWEALGERGITHIVVHWGEIRRYRSPGNYGFSSYIDEALLDRFVDEGVLRRVAWPIDTRIVELFERTDDGPTKTN